MLCRMAAKGLRTLKAHISGSASRRGPKNCYGRARRAGFSTTTRASELEAAMPSVLGCAGTVSRTR